MSISVENSKAYQLILSADANKAQVQCTTSRVFLECRRHELNIGTKAVTREMLAYMYVDASLLLHAARIWWIHMQLWS